MCQFGQKTQASGVQDTTAHQAGSNQSQGLNIFGGQLQNAGNNFFDAFSGQDPANSWMINAANQQQDPSTLGGYQSAANTIAQQGNDPGKTGQWMSPYIQNVINPTLAAQNLQNKQALSNLAGNQAVRGALGNNTGSAAAYLAGVQPAQQAQIGQLYQTGFTGAQAAQDASSKAQLGAIGTGQQGATSGNLALGQLGQNIQGGWQTFLGGLQNLMAPYGQSFTGDSTGHGTNSSTSTTSALGGNVAAAMGSLGLQALPFLLSDERVKSNIRKVGETNPEETGGLRLPIYAYNIGEGPTQMGLMAQDVEQVRPDAVHTAGGAGGIKMVDYDKATGGDNEGGEMMKPYNAGGAVNGSGGFHEKVGAAFHALKKMREGGSVGRAGMADGGFDLGGFSKAMSGGLDKMAQLSMPQQGQGQQNQQADQGQSALARALSSLNTPFRPEAGKTGTDSGLYMGGRVGYDAGGSPAHAFVGDPTRALQGFFNALNASELSQDKLGNDAPMVPFGPPVPTQPVPGTADWNLGREVQIGLPEGQTILTPSNSLPDVPSTGLEAAGLSPFHGTHHLPSPEGENLPSSLTPNVLRPFGREPVGTSEVTSLGATTGDPRVNPPNLPYRRETGKGPAPSWLESNLPGVHGFFNRQGDEMFSGADRMAMALGAMAGPLIGNPAGHMIPAATAAIQQRTLENNIAHQNAVLAETIRQHNTMADPDIVRQLRAAGIDPASAEGQALIRAHINRDRQEDAFTRGIGTASAAGMEAAQGAITAANGRLQNISQMEQLLAQPGVVQSRFGEINLRAREVAQALGFPQQGVAESQAFNTLAGRMALELRSTGTGAGMPGAMSDQDRAFLERMTPSLRLTPEGNRLIISMMRQMEQYKIAMNTELARYIQERRSNVGAPQHMTQWMQANPMAAVVPGVAETREQFNATIAGQAATPPTGGSGPQLSAAQLDAMPEGSHLTIGGVLHQFRRDPDGQMRWHPAEQRGGVPGEIPADLGGMPPG